MSLARPTVRPVVLPIDHHKAWVIVLVECSQVTHLLVRNGVLELQETVARISKGISTSWVGYIVRVNSDASY